jgi:hypothetical protein
MISDISNSSIKNAGTDVLGATRQNQLPVSQVSAKFQSNNSATNFNFPSNDEIAEKTELALQQQQQGMIVKPGSIVNILV